MNFYSRTHLAYHAYSKSGIYISGAQGISHIMIACQSNLFITLDTEL